MQKVDFDKHADEYEKVLSDELSFFGEESSYFADYKINLVKNLVERTPNSILDFGCGIGRNLGFFSTYFPNSKIFAADISEKSIEVAHRNNPLVTFFTLSDNNVKSYSESFDLIFTSCVFHHIEPHLRQKSMADIYSMLKLNGVFINFEHNPFNPVTRKIVRECVWDADAILLKPDETISLAVNSGLKLLKKKYSLFFPASLKFLRGLENIIGWLPLGGQYFIVSKK